MASRELTNDETADVLRSIDETLQISRTVPNQATPTAPASSSAAGANTAAPGTSASLVAPTPVTVSSITAVSLTGSPITTSSDVITSSTAADSFAASASAAIATSVSASSDAPSTFQAAASNSGHQRSGNTECEASPAGPSDAENLPVSFEPASVATAVSSTPSTSSRSGDESGERDDGYADEQASSIIQNLNWRQDLISEELSIITQRPKHPHMAVPQRRINTYSDWPHKDTHPAAEMAEAGFYYTGKKDEVRCFYCSLGLEEWTRSNQPWVEHCRWHPCPFVKLNKGQSFVDAVQRLDSASKLPKISEQLMMYCVCRCDHKFLITEERVMHEVRIMNDSKKRNLTRSAAVLSRNTDQRRSQIMLLRRNLSINEDSREGVAGEGELFERSEDEQKDKRNLTECLMCCTEVVNVLFHPCGHFIACAQCAPALEMCGMCRQPVEGLVPVNLD